jgi:hypothetical protein
MQTRSANSRTRSAIELALNARPLPSLKKTVFATKEKVGANPPDETAALRASEGLYGKG